MKKIRIIFEEHELTAELNDSSTARLIAEAMPFEAMVSTWGEEIYFGVPVACPEEAGAREILESGELAFWPVGSAFCIFFGPTPASSDSRPRAYSPVNVFGRITSDLLPLKGIKPGCTVRVEHARG